MIFHPFPAGIRTPVKERGKLVDCTMKRNILSIEKTRGVWMVECKSPCHLRTTSPLIKGTRLGGVFS
jgi:hypothetical protein